MDAQGVKMTVLLKDLVALTMDEFNLLGPLNCHETMFKLATSPRATSPLTRKVGDYVTFSPAGHMPVVVDGSSSRYGEVFCWPLACSARWEVLQVQGGPLRVRGPGQVQRCVGAGPGRRECRSCCGIEPEEGSEKANLERGFIA